MRPGSPPTATGSVEHDRAGGDAAVALSGWRAGPAVRATGAALAYAAIFAVVASPLLPRLGDCLPAGDPFSNGLDARLIVWIADWIAFAVGRPLEFFLDAPIHAPLRGTLTGSELFVSSQLVTVPLIQATGNPLLAVNVVVLLTYPLAALAMRALLRAYGCRPAVAWVGGLGFGFGALRVPMNVQLLQYANVWLAANAWAIRRLRDHPTARRTAILAATTTLGALSSFYMVPMLAVVSLLCVAVELMRPLRGRIAFLWRAGVAAAIAAVPLIGVAWPYLHHAQRAFGARIGGLQPVEHAERFMFGVMRGLVFGDVLVVLATVGVALAWRGTAETRRMALLGGAIVVVGMLLVTQPEPLPALVAATPLRFLRSQTRFMVVVDVGIALLVAAALEVLVRWVPGRLGRIGVPVAVAVALVLTRGLGFVRVLDPVAPLSADRAMYEAVAAITAGGDAMPLLELPLTDARTTASPPPLRRPSLEPDAMLGGTIHRLPLVTGHSAYPPAHRAFLDRLMDGLPDTLADLVDATGIGWVLLRPAEQWADPARRDALLANPILARRYERDGWTLAAVMRHSQRPQWVRAIQEGPRPGHTILGTPFDPWPVPLFGARLMIVGVPPVRESLVVAAGRPMRVQIRVDNVGVLPWPVLAAPGDVDARSVGLRVRWLTRDGLPVLTDFVPLERDVFPRESMFVTAWLPSPGEPDTYQLEIRAEQVGVGVVREASAMPFRARVVVGPRVADAATTAHDGSSPGVDGLRPSEP